MGNDTRTCFKNDKLIRVHCKRTYSTTTKNTKILHTTKNTGTPRRPVINSINCHTNTISKYDHFHLQLIAKNIPSYVRDPNRFPSKIRSGQNILDNSLLVTLDVKSLYTNIPNNEDAKAVRKAYDNDSTKTVAVKVIIAF